MRFACPVEALGIGAQCENEHAGLMDREGCVVYEEVGPFLRVSRVERVALARDKIEDLQPVGLRDVVGPLRCRRARLGGVLRCCRSARDTTEIQPDVANASHVFLVG